MNEGKLRKLIAILEERLQANEKARQECIKYDGLLVQKQQEYEKKLQDIKDLNSQIIQINQKYTQEEYRLAELVKNTQKKQSELEEIIRLCEVYTQQSTNNLNLVKKQQSELSFNEIQNNKKIIKIKKDIEEVKKQYKEAYRELTELNEVIKNNNILINQQSKQLLELNNEIDKKKKDKEKIQNTINVLNYDFQI